MTKKNATQVTLLAYANCDTCKKAITWLKDHDVVVTMRPIVDEPPTVVELGVWIRASDVSVRKWLNTSGQSYRAIGKEKVDAASDVEVTRWLAKDGKLVKRPVLVRGALGSPDAVLVGFSADRYEAMFA
jgi:arsenate reductase